MPPKKKSRTKTTIPSKSPAQDDDEAQHQELGEPSAAPSRTKTAKTTNHLDLTQKVARLLSQEPSAQPLPTSLSTNLNQHAPAIPLLNLPDLNHQLNSLIDQRVEIFEEKIKLYQNQVAQLRRELETKDQLLDELQKIRKTDAEHLLEKHKQIAETKFAAYEKLTKSQDESIKELRQKVIDLNAKLSRVYSGEEERDRQRLEEEKEALVQNNQQLKAAHDAQRKRRKEAERAAQNARSSAEEAVREQLQEANDEVETLKKMLAAETENSKAMIVQLNQLRSNSTSSNSNNPTRHLNSNNTNSNNSANQVAHEKTIDDLKRRLSLIGDFTGFEILKTTYDKKAKGPIYECIFADILNRGYALHFKLQVHPDETCSYTPSIDPERDSETIKVAPEFLRQFVRFGYSACPHVYWKLFQAFNLQDV